MKLNAIIIDDDSRDISTIKALVENYFDDIEIVDTALVIDDGFKIIRDKKPEVVFLDIHMPRGEGYDLLERFPKRNFDVIIISGSEGYRKDIKKYQIFDYLMKPIDMEQFKDTVQKLFNYRKENTDISYKIF